jgi:hypothetical protein
VALADAILVNTTLEVSFAPSLEMDMYYCACEHIIPRRRKGGQPTVVSPTQNF